MGAGKGRSHYVCRGLCQARTGPGWGEREEKAGVVLLTEPGRAPPCFRLAAPHPFHSNCPRLLCLQSCWRLSSTSPLWAAASPSWPRYSPWCCTSVPGTLCLGTGLPHTLLFHLGSCSALQTCGCCQVPAQCPQHCASRSPGVALPE